MTIVDINTTANTKATQVEWRLNWRTSLLQYLQIISSVTRSGQHPIEVDDAGSVGEDVTILLLT